MKLLPPVHTTATAVDVPLAHCSSQGIRTTATAQHDGANIANSKRTIPGFGNRKPGFCAAIVSSPHVVAKPSRTVCRATGSARACLRHPPATMLARVLPVQKRGAVVLSVDGAVDVGGVGGGC